MLDIFEIGILKFCEIRRGTNELSFRLDNLSFSFFFYRERTARVICLLEEYYLS